MGVHVFPILRPPPTYYLFIFILGCAGASFAEGAFL